MEQMTEIQRKIFEYLRECSGRGLPPSVREIGSALSIKSTSSVHAHLNKLEELGYIKRDTGRNRAIHITDESPVVQVPLLGKVTAGLPIYAFEEIVAYIPFSGDSGNSGELFALRVSGESMIDAAILDGDIVVCEKCSAVDNGQIAVVMIDDEATVKRYFNEGKHIRLQPENSFFEPIITKNATVLGRVISCIRYYS